MAGSPRARGSLAGRAVCRPRRKWRDSGSTSADQLGTSRRAALAPRENLRRGHGLRLGAAPRTQPAKSALGRTRSPQARQRRARRARDPACGAPVTGGGWLPGRAEVRQGSCPRDDAAGPGARAELTAVTEAPWGRGMEARVRRRGGSQGRLLCALDRPHSRRRRRLRPRALRCHEPEGGERSRESLGSGARRPRLPRHVPPSRPIGTGGRGDVRAAAWPMTAGPRHVAGLNPMGGAGAT